MCRHSGCRGGGRGEQPSNGREVDTEIQEVFWALGRTARFRARALVAGTVLTVKES